MATLADHIRFNRVIFRNQVFTARYLTRAIDDCARCLDAGISSNSPIVYLHAPNHVKTLIAFFAIVKTGRTCLLTDPAVGAIEFEQMFIDTPPAAVIRINTEPVEFDFSREIAFTGGYIDPAVAAQLCDVCILLHTAAEDGYPKAAMLTYDNILASAAVIAEDNHINDRSVSCALIPFDHIFGFQYGIITPLFGGGSLLISDAIDFYRMDKMAERIRNAGVTHLYSVPIVYYMLGKSSCSAEIGRNAHMICGGYKLRPSLRRSIQKNFSARIYEGYGLTETTAGCVWQQKTHESGIDSLGRPVRNCQIRISGPDGRPLPADQLGEICVKGPQVAKGYFNAAAAWNKSVVDGWFHTGDFGSTDPAGNLFFHGLKKKMFNVAGNKAYPAELQRLILKHPAVESVDLQSTASEHSGDRIKAAITLKPGCSATKDEFSLWLRKNIRPSKIPSTISFT